MLIAKYLVLYSTTKVLANAPIPVLRVQGQKKGDKRILDTCTI